MAALAIGFVANQSLPPRKAMVPIGGIIQWPRPIVEIPSNYQLCDGTNGTPDMRNQFVIGAGDTYNVNDTGGSLEHDHPFTGDGHVHASQGTVNVAGAGPGLAKSELPGEEGTMSTAAAGTTGNGDNVPPFHSLFFIQRMT